MKKILFISSALLLFTTYFISCKKNDGPTPFDLIRVPQVQVEKVDGSDAVIDVLNLSGFKGKFTVGSYYSDDKIVKMDVVVIKNGDNASAKVFKAGLTTFPSELEVTAADFESLFGEPVELNDSYDVGGDVYLEDGSKYEAFPKNATANGGGVSTLPGASPFVRYSAVCAYDPEIYQGDFEVVRDDFQDLMPGDIVTITKIDDTHFSYIYPSGVNPIPIVVAVNPLTNTTSIAKQKFGDYFTWEPAYTNPNVKTGTSVDNVVLPCDKTFTVVLEYTVDQGSFGGGWVLTMKKVE